MSRQALIVGMGQFGMSLARSLTEAGLDVMAVDQRPELVQVASAFAAEAVCFDASDEELLARTAPARRDVCICAIGNESREGAIIVTALLRQLGARRLVARATDPLMERILLLVGAHEVVNPERAFGERLAKRLLYAGIVEEVPLGEDLVINELVPPPAMIGRTLVELELPKRYNVTVVAIRREVGGRGTVIAPKPLAPLETGDILVVVSPPGAAQRMMERI